MVTLVLPRFAALGGTARRASTMIERNVATLRSMYWVVLATGFLEPLFYLFSIGVGVGALVGDITLPGGQVVEYAAFVAPAMLAAASMTGVLSETTFNFYAKLKWLRLYEGILATPVRPIELALGELVWAMLRGTVYAVAFLAVMVAMDLTTPARAALAFPASMLIGLAFGGAGMALSTFMRSWQDFDLMASAQFALFLFSGTFVPATAYPAAVRWLIEVTPLYRSVDLIRGITTGSWGWVQALDVGYLVVLFAVGLTIAGRRMTLLLSK